MFTSTILRTAKLSLKISRGMLAFVQHLPTEKKNNKNDLKHYIVHHIITIRHLDITLTLNNTLICNVQTV